MVSDIKKAENELEEPIATNGIRPDWTFDEKDTHVDKTALLLNQMDKSVARINKATKIDDLALNLFVEPLFFALDLLTAYFKEKEAKIKEAQKARQQAKKAHINDALRAKGLTRNALANRVAYRTQRWLEDTSMLPRDERGNIKSSGLTRAQRFNYRKMLFAQRLPVTESGVYDFAKFSRSQKRQYAKYVMMYAMQNPKFKEYVESMMEATVGRAELKQMARIGTDMNLKYRSGMMYHRQQERSRAS